MENSERRFDLFLSVVVVIDGDTESFLTRIIGLQSLVQAHVSSHEIIIVDNHSGTQPTDFFDQITNEDGFKNFQCYSLLRRVDLDIAVWAGVSRALGDCIISVDFSRDDINVIPNMLEEYQGGSEIVYAINSNRPPDSVIYRTGFWVYRKGFKLISGIDLAQDSSNFRLQSRRIVNYLSGQSEPHLAGKTLSNTAGIDVARVRYASEVDKQSARPTLDGLKRAISLLMSVNRAPLRLASFLCLAGCLLNVMYSCYVVSLSLNRDNLAEGWVSLSLQQSGMFFLISTVLFFLSEYAAHFLKATENRSNVFIAGEATSAKFSVKDDLNVNHGNG